MGNRWIWNLTIILVFLVQNVYGTGVFRVHNKFRSRRDMIHNNGSLSDYKAHDYRRHSRILSQADVDLPLGGNGDPTDAGLYFASIGIGNPSNDYYVQVDTGSDIFWVNCIECKKCPTKSNLGIKLKLYNPKASLSAKLVTCKQDFCSATYDGGIPGCTSDMLCEYRVVYGDGSSTDGYFVNDIVQYDQVSGNLATTSANATVTFGCGAKQSGDLGTSTGALDGLLGFGQANTSMISQLAAAGKVKKMFAHCLDGIKGGGIFAIGQVVQPKVKTTPLVPNQPHYNVNLKSIEVGKATLQLPTDVFETGDRRGTIIDSGTTLSYLPEVVYEPLILAILSHQSDLKLQTIENQFTCFDYIGSVDDGFPLIKFHFEDSLTLTVYPHDYLFSYHVSNEDMWCIGWQNSGMQSKDGKDTILLGDLALSDKLVVYDLENQSIGWIEYNCSSSIKMKDEQTGRIYDVASHDISSASSLIVGRLLLFFLLTAMLQSLIQ
ncbi:aspartic proteinase-like protein 2 isoform X1 [Papaver somniferum]|uniref:aspartic proteinase-like protein 2 isoform X1 n=1 Tax=Papaver somniferum TaxID=3469 RepID=UPI000E705A0B|nr:aspartic proteinase-like protein 2 isoform X1 [Papaver somniferum]